MKYLFLLILVILFGSTFLTAQNSQKFNIVFLADSQYAGNPNWIMQIKKWGATGINYRIYRHLLDDGNCNIKSAEWMKIKNNLKLLSDSSLDIFIRVNMFITDSTLLVNRYGKDDYQQTNTSYGVMYSTYYSKNIPTLNLTSTKAFNDRISFFKRVIDSLAALPQDIRIRIKLIVPTISQDDETELTQNTKYPPAGMGTWGWLSGYAVSDQLAFMEYLTNKYQTAANLSAAWVTTFDAIDTINIKIKEYDWQNIKDNYNCPNGRKDFIDFLTSRLKRFIDTCAYVVHNANTSPKFNIGVHFGSVYDGGIEFKAFYDVTPLLEKVNTVVCDDIAEYKPNFNFAADYLRSVCNYWNWKRKKDGSTIGQLTFGTETNWPGYNHIMPDTLVKYWKAQLQSYYDRGASTLSISHWGTIDLAVYWSNPNIVYKIGNLIKNNALDRNNKQISSTAYQDWRNTLNNFKSLPVKTIPFSSSVVHLSPIMALYSKTSGPEFARHIHNLGKIVDSLVTYDGANSGITYVLEFPLYQSIKPHPPYSGITYYNEHCDIITDYMLENSPEYLEKR